MRGLVRKPGKHQSNKQRCQDLCWKVHDPAQSFVSLHALCMSYVTNTFLLVSSSVRSKQLLCFVHGQGQKREQKHTTKNFDEFHNHSPLLTMKKLTNNSYRSWIRHYTKPCDRNQKTGLDEYFCPLHPFAAAGLITLKASNFRLSTEYFILTKSKNWNQMRSIEKTNNMMSFLYDIPTQSSVC